MDQTGQFQRGEGALQRTHPVLQMTGEVKCPLEVAGGSKDGDPAWRPAWSCWLVWPRARGGDVEIAPRGPILELGGPRGGAKGCPRTNCWRVMPGDLGPLRIRHTHGSQRRAGPVLQPKSDASPPPAPQHQRR
ncbi:hypothetical protein NDU88_000950 [Pleurodeles waltl]|uniref:Uncharacterized protein n=1 Tax=Pleurodeles waltl TaxID=8319 RepID=A0AAV7VYF0_PLEWA|nr:hypothetical protein NDU88_000950 [Pleurodeles waltl]